MTLACGCVRVCSVLGAEPLTPAEHEVHSADHAKTRPEEIKLDGLLHVKDSEAGKDDHRQDLLDDL